MSCVVRSFPLYFRLVAFLHNHQVTTKDGALANNFKIWVPDSYKRTNFRPAILPLSYMHFCGPILFSFRGTRLTNRHSED